MPLTRLWVENFRCFSKRQELEIRPITVVLGKNNSGKSALVRAPLVLSAGILNSSPLPLDLARLGDEPPEFVDLIHKRLGHGNVTIGFEFDDEIAGSVRIDATIQNIDEWQTQVISQWAIRTAEMKASLEWLAAHDTENSDLRPYRIVMNGEPAEMGVRFKGLLLAQMSFWSPAWIQVFEIQARIRAGWDHIRHIGPFRTRPRRTNRPAGSSSISDDLDMRTIEVLIRDHIRGRGRLTSKINEYLGDHIPGWELDVVPKYDAYSVGLKSKVERGLWVALPDAGTGVAQVLPILVRRAMDDLDPPAEDILEIVEEPELHLHPAAQAELADVFASYVTATEKPRVRFLIETHSETFLLRLRRRVAEGRLSPDMLALYYVASTGEAATAQRINVDQLGNVDHWPQGIFAEDFEETKALTVAQIERQDTDAG
jgi:hypothetical protein